MYGILKAPFSTDALLRLTQFWFLFFLYFLSKKKERQNKLYLCKNLARLFCQANFFYVCTRGVSR
jgi:hypothetical protein